MSAVGWVLLGIAGGYGLCTIVVLGLAPRWIASAATEDDLGPYAHLPTFDDAEAAALLEAGA